MLTEQQFTFRIESGIEGGYLWNDEMTKAIGMSCVPSEIAAEENQVKQLKALLEWFKHDFFSWCDSPACQSCKSKEHM